MPLVSDMVITKKKINFGAGPAKIPEAVCFYRLNFTSSQTNLFDSYCFYSTFRSECNVVFITGWCNVGLLELQNTYCRIMGKIWSILYYRWWSGLTKNSSNILVPESAFLVRYAFTFIIFALYLKMNCWSATIKSHNRYQSVGTYAAFSFKWWSSILDSKKHSKIIKAMLFCC